MFKSKHAEKAIFVLIFINHCIILSITSISISTSHWVVVNPYRGLPSEMTPQKSNDSNSTWLSSFDLTNDRYENYDFYYVMNEDKLLPFDLDGLRDCRRYTGKIRFGLFRGVWLLNYAYGCKNRLNHVSIIDILRNHKIFDQTLWVSCILSCALGLFSTLICSIFPLVNIFITSDRNINAGPTSIYLWNTIAGIFHAITIILFCIEYHLYIKNNVLTKYELEKGWVSTDCSRLSWSFYLLIASMCLICLNYLLIRLTVHLKRDSSSIDRIDLNTEPVDAFLTKGTVYSDIMMTSDYNQIEDPSATKYTTPNLQRGTSLSASKKMKRIIDLAY